jgi:hypothetical protein
MKEENCIDLTRIRSRDPIHTRPVRYHRGNEPYDKSALI